MLGAWDIAARYNSISDPWFKKATGETPIGAARIVDTLATYLIAEGIVFLQSDVEAVAKEMCDRFDSHPAFQKQGTDTWLSTNPLPVSTEREIYTLSSGEPVYRALYTRLSRSTPTNIQ
jgi:tRNA (guanine-N7-)-methyltransferase